jgi:hypothetical protein
MPGEETFNKNRPILTTEIDLLLPLYFHGHRATIPALAQFQRIISLLEQNLLAIPRHIITDGLHDYILSCVSNSKAQKGVEAQSSSRSK